MPSIKIGAFLLACVLAVGGYAVADEATDASQPEAEQQMRALLDAPLLFTKRHSYSGIHIYDTYYKWPPGGGGIYVIENPAAPKDQWKIRTVIDPTTPNTLGLGVYHDPELSDDATKLLFCFKGEPAGSTSIYEIGVDGTGLRRLTDPAPACDCYKGSHAGQHDVCPAYLPDGRIVFLSTRPSGLVPCNNTGVAILHVMNADGSDMHTISVNNVNEFDPVVLPDGRLLFGRWEYVDKNALTIQSLWTMNPDGTQETSFFANNMVFPEAILDVRPVPNSHLIVGTFAKHNSTPRGSIAMVDPRKGKNGLEPITNFEHPEDPTHDRGNSCEPWPLSEDVVLLSGRPGGYARNVIEMIDRAGHRFVVHAEPDICLHSPMLVKPRQAAPILVDSIDPEATTGRFLVQDIYRGLDGVERGEIKWLRVLEETSRTSARPSGGNPYNQTFLVSSALAFGAKSFLGMVPVDEDGSAYFEVPAGRAVYLQALDADGRMVQSMRTFVQAAPGTTRSCIGCHEDKFTTTATAKPFPDIATREPDQLKPESWGSGYLDYASQVQPVLDKNCVSCHGGEEGIAGGMDLSGGWTEHFNISYENLTNRAETQLVAYWISGIDCMNGTALWSAQRFGPREHGSGAAPLAKLLVDGHDGYISKLTRRERDLLMAWIDTNGLYYGSWDYSPGGCSIPSWGKLRGELTAKMQAAGCLECHGDGNKAAYFENDWINLENPEHSRLLRAPLAGDGEGLGLEYCRNRKVDPSRKRIHLLRRGYAHAVQPPAAFPKHPRVVPDRSGEPVVSFASSDDADYQAMLEIIRRGRETALASPRVDMPGAEIVSGTCRLFVPPPVPQQAPALAASTDDEGVVTLTWERSAATIGLLADVHRSDQANFTPDDQTRIACTALSRHVDREAPVGVQHYALVIVSDDRQSEPRYATVHVPSPPPPKTPVGLEVLPASCAVRLKWEASGGSVLGYHVYRAKADGSELQQVTPEPIRQTTFTDGSPPMDVPLKYAVRAISGRGLQSEPTAAVDAIAKLILDPMFTAEFTQKQARGLLHGGKTLPGKLHGGATGANSVLDLAHGGHATFPHQGAFDLGQPLSMTCWIWIDEPGTMPVFVSCGHWQKAGWFLQRLGGTWRWHVGGVDCDGGKPALKQWLHVAATFDGQTARLYENGKLLAETAGAANTAVWPGELFIGQYSGTPGPDFQVTGRIAGVEIYNRALEAAEIAKAAKSPPQ